jgi:thiamine transport system substrate-binding protein
MTMSRREFLLLVSAAAGLAGCQAIAMTPAPQASPSAGTSTPVQATPTSAASTQPTTLVLASHNSFSASKEVIAQFEQDNNAKLQVLELGDAGQALNKIILSKDAPLADAFYGVDNTFLSRALNADIFVPYTSPLLDKVPDNLKLDPSNQMLPVDHGFVNINADKAWFADHNLALPKTLEDFTKSDYKGLLVVENPATSSPGLAFLLATIGHFGADSYLDFWRGLQANDVLVTDGWNEAYYSQFTVGSGGSGDRPLVVSYTTSPPADVIYAQDGRTEPQSVNIDPPTGTFHQIEFVGVLKGTQHEDLARKWVDYMLSITFQNDIPLQMFVYPVNEDAQLPELFQQYAKIPADPAQVSPADIEANRESWIQAWTDVMLH